MSEDQLKIIRKIFDPLLQLDDVIVCPIVSRIFVIVRQAELGLARRLAPVATVKTNFDVFALTQQELDDRIERAFPALASMELLSEENVEDLVSQGVFALGDLSEVDSVSLCDLLGFAPDQAKTVIREAAIRSRRDDDDGE